MNTKNCISNGKDAEKMMSWIDLPEDHLELLLGYKTPQVSELNKKFSEYHLIPKSKEDFLEQRICKLHEIERYINHWLEFQLSGVEKEKHLRKLSQIALGKASYLAELSILYKNESFDAFNLEQMHHQLSEDDFQGQEVVFLTHRNFFSLNQMQYWGDFWMESVDPCHRQMTHYYKVWERLSKNDPSTPHYFLWLEEQYVPPYTPRAFYYSPEQLKEKRVFVKEGLLVNSKGHPVSFDKKNCSYVFIVDLDRNLLVELETENIFHTSLGVGRPVLSAGKITVTRGQVTSVSFESGHYIPSVKVGYQLLEILLKKGYNLNSQSIDVTFFYDRNKYSINVPACSLKDFKSFQRTLSSGSPLPCSFH